MQKELKRVAESLELNEKQNAARFSQMEVAQNTRMDRMEATLKAFLQKASLLQLSPHASSSSTKETWQPQPFQVRNVKLDFPHFDGKKVIEWIFKAEQIFEYYDTPDPNRLTIATVHLDQEVIPWFQMMQRNHPFQSWQAFARALEVDFGPSMYDCPSATLFKLAQTGSVSGYYMTFTSLANRAYGLSLDALLDCFLSGLQADIRREVMAQSPISLLKAVALAKLFEEKYTTLPKATNTYQTHKQATTNTTYTNRYTSNTTPNNQ